MKLGQRTDTPTGTPASDRQRRFILALGRRLRMPGRMMDDWLVATFGGHLDDLTVDQASEVIDVLNGWDDIPPDIRRASGQRELF